jgi:hypothetical protein
MTVFAHKNFTTENAHKNLMIENFHKKLLTKIRHKNRTTAKHLPIGGLSTKICSPSDF